MNPIEAIDKLAIYETVYGPIKDLEWSGYARGQGFGPMGSGDDGAEYPACPVCGGLEKPNNEFIESAVGHQPGCRLAAALGAPTRKLVAGEQGRMAL